MTESQAHYSTSVLNSQDQNTHQTIIEQWECEEAWSQADFFADHYLAASYINPQAAETYRQQMFAATETAHQLQTLFNAQRERNVVGSLPTNSEVAS